MNFKLDEQFPITVKTLEGLEQLLADELTSFGATDVKILVRAVSCKGNREVLYKANYLCRMALKVMVPVHSFPAPSDQKLYDAIADMPWEQVLQPDQTFAIDGVTYFSQINHSKYLALKAKDAIADRFRRIYGSRPSVDVENPYLRINLHLSSDICTVALDSSGESLHLRGYRKEHSGAPVSEVLAAGIVGLSGWDGKSNFIDFMCGSGTLLIEAAMKACNIPAGKFRKSFAFQKWLDFDNSLWKKIRNEAAAAEITDPEIFISGGDISPRAVAIAAENIRKAGLDEIIDVYPLDFRELEVPQGSGTVIVNPPYGERIKPDDLMGLYEEIGNVFKRRYTGYNAWVLTSNLEAAKFIGLKTSRRIALINGALECKLLGYKLYEGSKKGKYIDAQKEEE